MNDNLDRRTLLKLSGGALGLSIVGATQAQEGSEDETDDHETNGEVVTFTTSAADEEVDDDSDTVTIVGRETTAHYEFTVDGSVEKSTAYDGTINEYDTIHDDGRVTGRTTNEPDSFAVDGDVVGFHADAPVDVSLNGDSIDPDSFGDHVLTVVGDGGTAHYEFTVDGSVGKSTAHGGTINDFDTVHDDGRVTGRTTHEPDSFAIDGDITEFEADAPVDVLLDGNPVDPEALGGDVITIVGDGETAHYEFTVDGSVAKSTAYDGTINDFDTIHDDGRVTGRTTNEPDSFAIDGDLVAFDADADVTVHLNGQEVDPELLGSFVVTVTGRGSTAYYEFMVDGSVEKSTAYDGTINEYDTIHDDGRVTGRTTNEPDSFDCTGILHSFESDAPVDVYADGEPIDSN